MSPLLLLFIIINLISFIIVALDKRKAVKGSEYKRTPEGFIFFLAAAFGAVGVYAAMQLFRHKTRKWYFQLGIPLIAAQNLVLLYCIHLYIAPLW